MAGWTNSYMEELLYHVCKIRWDKMVGTARRKKEIRNSYILAQIRERNIFLFLWKYWNDNSHSKALKETGVRVWTGFVWRRIVYNVTLC
jgi:hypothetical protein